MTASVTLPSVEASSITRPGDARGTRAAPPSDAIHEFDPFVAEVEELAARGGGFDTQPVVVRRTSDVLPNAHLGVAGGYQVEVLFVGTTLARGWLDALPVETRAWVQGHKEAAGMPHVSTMKIDYDPSSRRSCRNSPRGPCSRRAAPSTTSSACRATAGARSEGTSEG